MESRYDVLEQIFSQIPTIQGFKPVFEYGSHEDLLRFLSMKRKQGVAYYPLIWLVTPVTFGHGYSNVEYDKLTIIVATLTNQDLSNKERNEVTFKGVLNPLVDYIVHSLKTNRATSLKEGYSITDYFNYVTNDEKQSSDLWDAKKLELSTYFRDNCKVNNTHF